MLRGDYKQSEYSRVILPLVVLRRLDCVLEPTKANVLAEHAKLTSRVENVDPILETITGHKDLYNTSKFDLPKLLDDPNHVADNLRAYIAGGARRNAPLRVRRADRRARPAEAALHGGVAVLRHRPASRHRVQHAASPPSA